MGEVGEMAAEEAEDKRRFRQRSGQPSESELWRNKSPSGSDSREVPRGCARRVPGQTW